MKQRNVPNVRYRTFTACQHYFTDSFCLGCFRNIVYYHCPVDDGLGRGGVEWRSAQAKRQRQPERVILRQQERILCCGNRAK